ncbi:MAG: HEAT repeat domain-containing protein [Myxococcaceae bacterium]
MRVLLAGLLVSVFTSQAALADGRMTYLVRQLEKANDPRLRAQSALMLSATQDPASIPPLCNALNDSSDIVRSASAKALGELGDAKAQPCLKAHQNDPNDNVKAAIAKALSGFGRRPELYIAILPVLLKSNKLAPDLGKLAEERLRAKLATMGTVFAPPDESKNTARSVIRGKNLKGYALKVEIDETPSGGLRMNILCWTYPDQALQGQVSVKASGAQPEDLIRALAPKAIEDAADTFDWSS